MLYFYWTGLIQLSSPYFKNRKTKLHWEEGFVPGYVQLAERASGGEENASGGGGRTWWEGGEVGAGSGLFKGTPKGSLIPMIQLRITDHSNHY